MSKFLVLTLLLVSWSCAIGAQTERVRPERVNKAHAEKAVAEDPQQRRAAVRAALEAQREQKPTSGEPTSRAKRQLSPQERQELRRQLRQQTG